MSTRQHSPTIPLFAGSLRRRARLVALISVSIFSQYDNDARDSKCGNLGIGNWELGLLVFLHLQATRAVVRSTLSGEGANLANRQSVQVGGALVSSFYLLSSCLTLGYLRVYSIHRRPVVLSTLGRGLTLERERPSTWCYWYWLTTFCRRYHP